MTDPLAEIVALTGAVCCPPDADAGCGCRSLTPLQCVTVLVEERDRLQSLVLAQAERIAGQSELLSKRAEPMALLAILDRLSEADLNRLRSDTIPRLLRARVAAVRAEQYAEYLADYEAQGKPKKPSVGGGA